MRRPAAAAAAAGGSGGGAVDAVLRLPLEFGMGCDIAAFNPRTLYGLSITPTHHLVS